MNNIFNLQRFIWLFNKHSKETYKIYLANVVLLIGFLVGVMSYSACFEDFGVRTQEHIFWSFLISGGAIFCNVSAFVNLRDKNKAISTLTLPVSSFERFLVNWIYTFLIFQLVLIVCFYAVDMTVLSVINRNSVFATPMIDLTSSYIPPYDVFLCFSFLHALYFLSAATYYNYDIVKGLLLLLGFVIALVLFNLGLAHLLIGGNATTHLPFTQISIREGLSDYDLEDGTLRRILATSIGWISTFLLWAAAYFKLKEKQI
ncbi:MAG: hypothetical protein P0Y49_16100 [Candidatus Pedobacter colombiensis]|uniref:Uncharacterized protein n=1 Tax=Candidatus Pedobacter colombiensis TaxID=3121371 RepID=A0AAJ5W7A8_9SPHI|nr:hypothetical protein [Pedobacter sp.]WEK18314.1 MAG: hypothetical protein P0Y49_16100 [Pedobacter sp.]